MKVDENKKDALVYRARLNRVYILLLSGMAVALLCSELLRLPRTVYIDETRSINEKTTFAFDGVSAGTQVNMFITSTAASAYNQGFATLLEYKASDQTLSQIGSFPLYTEFLRASKPFVPLFFVASGSYRFTIDPIITPDTVTLRMSAPYGSSTKKLTRLIFLFGASLLLLLFIAAAYPQTMMSIMRKNYLFPVLTLILVVLIGHATLKSLNNEQNNRRLLGNAYTTAVNAGMAEKQQSLQTTAGASGQQESTGARYAETGQYNNYYTGNTYQYGMHGASAFFWGFAGASFANSLFSPYSYTPYQPRSYANTSSSFRNFSGVPNNYTRTSAVSSSGVSSRYTSGNATTRSASKTSGFSRLFGSRSSGTSMGSSFRSFSSTGGSFGK